MAFSVRMSKVLPLTVSLFTEIAGFNCASLERNFDLHFQQPHELILPLIQFPITSQLQPPTFG